MKMADHEKWQFLVQEYLVKQSLYCINKGIIDI